MLKLLNRIDKKYALAMIVGIIFGLLSVYTDFFRDSRPKIELEILSNSTVLDVKERVSKLDILYDNESILSQNLILSIITVKISNVGNSPITIDLYDPNSPFGIKISNGIILEKPTSILVSDEYLRNNIIIKNKDSTSIIFNNFIFDENEYFILKFLVLHNNKVSPSLTPIGKIAGIKEFLLTSSSRDEMEVGFWDTLTSGNLLIHISRFFFYVIVMIATGIFIFLPIGLISESFGKRKRKHIVNSFIKKYGELQKDYQNDLIKFFIDNNPDTFKRLVKYLNNKSRLSRIALIKNEDELLYSHTARYHSLEYSITIYIHTLIENKIIDDKYNMNQDYELFLNNFYSFINIVY